MEKRLMTLLVGLFLFVGGAIAQTKVSGTVVSQDDGEPVIGASILVVGTQVGTVTNANGQFSLTCPAGKNTLRITYIGMEPLEVTARPNMRIMLTSDSKALDEVIVVAYGTAKKSAFTGSAAEIKAADITSHVTSTATSALVGKVAGVQATSNSGAPGSAPTIRIRGIGSYAAASTPLYIIDGVPMEQGISTINPADIESMSVLKDASASAIYGNRGANGVIIITTKKSKGAAQDAEVTFDAKWGSNSRLVPRYDVITDPAQYYETQFTAMYNSQYYHGASAEDAYNWACKNLFDKNNGGLGYQVFTVPEGQNLIGRNLKMNPNATLGYSDGTYTYLPDNWYDETIGSAFRQEYNASVSGNTGRLSYFASAGYLNDGGQVSNSKFERYTARTNVEYQAKQWLKLTTNMSYTHRISQTPSYSTDTYGSSGNVFYAATGMGAIYPLYVRDAEGNIMKDGDRIVYDANQTNFQRPGFVGNAVRDNEYNSRQSFGDVFFGQWGVDINPIEGLNLKANLSANSINSRYTALYSRFGSGASVDGQAYVESTRTFSVNQQYLASYTRTIADLHNFSILAGYEQYKVKDQILDALNSHLYDPYIGELDNAKGPNEDMQIESNTDNYMTEGFLARANYDYDNRYFVNGSIRRDASSKFAPGHRWGTFWSVGGAWQISKEEFMKDVKWVDMLKLKLSYGENGNDMGMNWHAYSDRYTTLYNKDTKEYSITMDSKGNDELTWETKKAWNLGLEFQLFKNRLSGSIEVYDMRTSDLLWWKTVPLSSGIMVDDYPANIGTVQNKGIEVSLEGTIIKTRDFDWSLNIALAHNKNRITDLDPSVAETGLRSSTRILRIDGSLQHAYMVRYAGVDHETGEPQWWKAYTTDADGNEKALSNAYGDGPVTREELTKDITEATRYDCGDVLPTLNGGFGTSANFRGFDLSAQFSFQLGGKFYDGTYQQLMHNGQGQQTGFAWHKDVLDAWSETNKDSDTPRLSAAAADDPNGSQTAQDRFLTSSDYLCLNNLSLGYTLPQSLTQKLQIRKLRVYFAGENLFLLTARKGMDPRYNNGIGGYAFGGGLAGGSYSAMRSLTGGITVTF